MHGALMAKRLYMTSADYLAIAVSPALIMLLVGSLVFFLLEVVYVGEYQARLNYVFALFVFATVLVGRISIEMGSERAAMYSIPLALATFVVLQKFVEHPSVFSPLINIVLIAVVWWCAHRLTWDCTLIDDSVDASGEGLMQLAGVDDTEGEGALAPPQRNQLLPGESLPSFWQRMFSFETGPHAPGLWVLYFSLAALPIFGIGQGFIPASDTASHRYMFVLLFVYVASGLLLLVTTSFLGFRRYLRQRGVDMPTPMAMTWVAVGAVVTAIVLLVTTLLPRPSAEFSLAQAPRQARSPDGLTSSRYGRGSDGAEGDEPSTDSVTTTDENAPTGDTTTEGQSDRPPGESSEEGKQQSDSGEHSQPGNAGDQSQSGEQGESGEQSGQDQSQDSEQQGTPGEEASKSPEENSDGERASQGNEQQQENSEASPPPESSGDSPGSQSNQTSQQQNVQSPEHAARPPQNIAETMSDIAGGIAGLVKWLFYLVLALVCAFLLWKYRHELLAAARDMWRDLKAFVARLFGRETTDSPSENESTTPLAPRKRFRDFRNPFAGDAYRKVPPAELVRYTFEAFEAWSADRGHPRRADQTPQEFVESVAAERVENDESMRGLCRLYGRVAYGDGRITANDLTVLQQVWSWMSASSALVSHAE
jgi:hypothetical protein